MPVHSTTRKPAKRRYNIARIKVAYSYTIVEIEKLYGVHNKTVHGWIKRGLPVIDKRRPIKIFGGELKAFLTQEQTARKSVCKPHEIYCLKCRKPQTPWEKLVDIVVQNERQLTLKGLCPVCDSTLNRAGSIHHIDTYKLVFDVQNTGELHDSINTHNSVPKA